ncbi:MAG: sodium-translocating pyrophosphatase, partial [Defluviitaleaceae bacterium]|nr:sodium-translocating pyrophosphatase [Defluviitaleaceae bacterium]
MVEQLFWLGILGALTALLFAFVQGRKVLTYSEGNDKMVEIAQAIRTGAKAYLRRQYRLVTIFFSVMFVILLVLSLIGLVNRFIPFAFVVGGFFTGLSGFIGMTIATNANARTAQAASESLNKGLRVSFSSGTVMGFVVAGLGLLDVTAWYLLLVHVFNASTDEISTTMITFGMGVACMAMFSRVGGGIFTKAADVGADLVGKVEAGIPEDDPRNPATIADNVGDNVGDVAGMGADLYESYTNAIVATFALGMGAGYGSSGLLLPILLATVGIVSSLIGTFAVKTKEKANQKELLHALHRGTFISGGISIVVSLPLTFFVADLAGSEMAANTWGIFFSIVIGILTGFLIGWFTEYYTSDTNKPTKDLAKTTETGSATVMIGGISLGMFSTLGPVITIVVAAMASFFLSGGSTWVANPALGVDSQYFYAGLYGIGIAAVGMLATLSINLACDAFGPVADNAGGIAEMAGLPHEVRERTDALDSLGNTTAATGKGFAIGSTAFTALALLVSYVSLGRSALAEQGRELDLNVTNPSVLMGILLGSMLIFF